MFSNQEKLEEASREKSTALWQQEIKDIVRVKNKSSHKYTLTRGESSEQGP
jgi:hypothetical protein